MSAVYNENDPAAAAWLRELIANGLIAPGDVDERSIKDARADDYRRYDQVHCFAGIGLWSAALRKSGWPDDRPVGTGSCPCQPFSAAGKNEGFQDHRHLWPDWRDLIVEAREQGQRWADTLFIEQVASAGVWLDLVRTDLEALGYAFGSVDLPAAGFAQGAHIRQRFYGVADSDNAERWADMAAGHIGDWPQTGRIEGYCQSGAGRPLGGMADGAGRQSRNRQLQSRREHGQQLEDGGASQTVGHGSSFVSTSPAGGMGNNNNNTRLEGWRVEHVGGLDKFAVRSPGLDDGVDWLLCRDERIRPVEAGAFPLAPASPGRLGLLRGYGNGLDLETAVNFVSAYMEACEMRDVMAELT